MTHSDQPATETDYVGPEDPGRCEFVHHVSTIGGHAEAAHNAMQENDADRAKFHLEAIDTWVQMALRLLPMLQPLAPDVVERIVAERKRRP